MELRLLRTFVAVAELRHFARAAEQCNLSQPAVSHQIRLLEEELGTRLLNRAGRHVSPTVAGELLLEDARSILAAVDRARERVQGATSGTLGRVRLGATETAALYRLPALLETYSRRNPRFALQFAIASEAELLTRVAANDLDMAVISGRPLLRELQARTIGTDNLVLIAPATSPFAKRHRVTPADLRAETWILREEGSDTRRQIDAWLRRHRMTPPRVLTLQGPDAVKRAVIAGLGVSLVSWLVVEEELGAAKVAAIRVAGTMPSRDVLLVDHPQKHHGAACQAMIALLTAQ